MAMDFAPTAKTRSPRLVNELDSLARGYDSDRVGGSRIIHADCLEWLSRVPERLPCTRS